MSLPFSLLVLTSSDALFERLKAALHGAPAPPRSAQARTHHELSGGSLEPFDVVVIHDGAEDAFLALASLRSICAEVPVIVVADTRDNARMVDLLRAGVADVVWLHNLGRLGPAIERELRHVESSRAREHAESEVRRLAAIVASAELSIISRALDGTITSWNAGAERLFGFTAVEMVGERTAAQLPPDLAAEVRARRERIAAGGQAESFDTWRPRKDGSRVSVSMTVSPVRDAHGHIAGFSSIATDISARLRAEERLRQSEERSRRILDTMSNVVWMAKIGGVVDYVNRRGIELFGLEETRLDHVPYMSVIHPDDIAAAYAVWARSVGTHAGFRFECRLRHKDGSYRWYAVEGTPLAEEDGARTRWVGSCTDIHERVVAAQDNKRTAELLTAIAAGTPDVFYVKDAQHRYMLVNPAGARFMQRTVEELLGRDDTFVFPREEAAAMMERDRLVMETGRTISADHVVTLHGVSRRLQSTKGPYRDVSGNIVGVMGVSRDITEERRALEALMLRERAIEAASQGFVITDARSPHNPIVYVSPGVERITGYSSKEFLGRSSTFLQGKDTDPRAVAQVREAVATGQGCSVEMLNYRKDGTPFWNQLSVSPIRDDTGEITHYVGVQTDVTDRRTLEDQYRHAQKMEAVGQLAGGVAHDFNNLLTVINGYSDVLLTSMSNDNPDRELVEEIRQAGQLSSGLTRQLLAFSRKQVLAPAVLDLNQVVAATDKMLRRLIREDIRLDVELADELWSVRVDPGQIEQVLMNLAVNARDAMPSGGVVVIGTLNVSLTDAGEVQPGDYVRLRVSDNGVGMSHEVSSRIFEPFFTTKDPGHGTGLGLATVYGIVQQSGGQICVSSEVGQGTTFDIFLPRVVGADAVAEVAVAPVKGQQTVLLVEDEDSVRVLSRRVLEDQGHNVLCAGDGAQAQSVASAYRGAIDLLITDLVMPGASGRAVAERVTRDRPATRVLYVSGYAEDATLMNDMRSRGAVFLQKPFTGELLAARVREVLDGPTAK